MLPLNYCCGLHHIGIPVQDMQATESFYTKLGFTVYYKTLHPQTNLPVMFLQYSGTVLEFYQSPDAPCTAGTIDHIAFTVRDTNAAYKAAMALQCKVLTNGIEELPFFENGVRFFTIEGPNKEKLEFCQYL